MQPAGHHIAELNIGRLIAPTDDPRVAEFMANLDRINGLGNESTLTELFLLLVLLQKFITSHTEMTMTEDVLEFLIYII